MAEQWRPLDVREGWIEEAEYDSLHEGVPEWLRASLTSWVTLRLTRPTGFGPREGRAVIEDRLRVIERTLRQPLGWKSGPWPALHGLLAWAQSYPDRFLTAVDVLLSRLTLEVGEKAVEELEEILAQGGSAWRVAMREDTCCLERRVDEAIQGAGK